MFSCRTAFAEGFVRPSAWYLDYTASGLPSKGGVSVAMGASLDSAKHHELSVEVAHAPWSWNKQGGFAGLGWTGSGHITPVSLNYRYSFRDETARARFYIGGSGGVSKLSGDVLFTGSGARYGGPVDKTQAAWGATAGISGALTSALSYDVGYRYLHTDGFDVSTTVGATSAGPKIQFPNTSAHILALSLNVRF